LPDFAESDRGYGSDATINAPSDVHGISGVEPTGIEFAKSVDSCGETQRAISILPHLESAKPASPRAEGDSQGVIDAVEEALVHAMSAATGAGRFDVVMVLAKELEARRLAHAAKVISLEERRTKRS
jgi:hypothetical protein